MKKILNAENLLRTAAFLALLAIPGAVEAGMYLTAAALGAILAGCAWMASRESGK